MPGNVPGKRRDFQCEKSLVGFHKIRIRYQTYKNILTRFFQVKGRNRHTVTGMRLHELLGAWDAAWFERTTTRLQRRIDDERTYGAFGRCPKLTERLGVFVLFSNIHIFLYQNIYIYTYIYIMNIFIIQIYILIIHINYIQFTAVKLNQLMLTNCSCTVGWGFDRTNTACVVGEIRISVDQTVEASSAVMCHHRHTCSWDVLRMSWKYLISFFNLLYVPYPFISSWYVAYRDYLHQYIVISGIRYILAAGLGSWIWRTVALSWMSGLKSHAASPRYGTLPTFGAKIKVMLSNATMPGHRCFETLQSTEFPHCYQTSLSGAPELRNFWIKKEHEGTKYLHEHKLSECREIQRPYAGWYTPCPHFRGCQNQKLELDRLHVYTEAGGHPCHPCHPFHPCHASMRFHEIRTPENSENTNMSSNTCLSRQNMNV